MLYSFISALVRRIHVPKYTMVLPNVVFVLGGPGAGKGTQCAKIVETFGYTHLSAGDLLRAEKQKPDSEVGVLIAQHIKEGSIVPVEITCGLLEKAMTETMTQDPKKDSFLIDGFPRNQDNLDGWNKQMNGKHRLQFVLFFDCSEDICVQRCLHRGQTSGRTDDNEESLKKRINTYNLSTKSIIDHYDKQGLVRLVDATPPADHVFEEVRKHFT